MPAAGKPLLEHLMERVAVCGTVDRAIVATSTNSLDDAIVDFCQHRGFPAFRGSEFDVLDRYYRAARHYDLDVIVRVTADCPLFDPPLADRMITLFLQHAGDIDLVTNRHPLTFPDGLDVDVMSMAGLEHAWRNAKTPYQREHTIPFFWESGMRVLNVEDPGRLFYRHRWTLDYLEDYQLIKAVVEGLYRPEHVFGVEDIINFLKSRPELSKLNAAYLPANAHTVH